MPAVSEQSRWVDGLPEDSFFALQDVPGPSLGAVRAFLHREASGSGPRRRIVRLAPSLYWKAGETYRIDGQLYLPSRDRIGEAYAGPHAAAAEYHGASRAGWLTQVPVRFTFAVPGEPRSRNPIAGVKLVGRRNPRRRELNTSEATYLEAVATFDRWANADPLVGDPWHDALERASILLGWRMRRGVIVPDPDALLHAAATERPLSRRVFRERVEELAAMIARVVADPGGLAACSNKQGKKLLDEYQQRVAAVLGVTAQRQGPGGGNLFRTVLYEYVSALPNVVDPAVESDMGIRDIDPKYIITLPGQPYVARAGMPLPASTGGAPMRCMHPITTLVDKLDAVCWREGSVAANPQQALASLSARVRDHYDIYMLIAWLAGNNQLHAHDVRDAVAHMQHSDAEVRKRRNVNRPIEPPPASGYRTLRAWQPGTVEYQHLQQAYPSLQAFVYGPLPPWPAVASRIRGCRFI